MVSPAAPNDAPPLDVMTDPSASLPICAAAICVLLKLPVCALVDRHRPTSDRWPGIILEVSDDQIVREKDAIKLTGKFGSFSYKRDDSDRPPARCAAT